MRPKSTNTTEVLRLPFSQIAEVATKYSRTPAQVILCYLLCRGISVIPKSNNEKRIIENFGCIFDLAEEDFNIIDNLVGECGERGQRNLDSREYLGFDNYNEEYEKPKLMSWGAEV